MIFVFSSVSKSAHSYSMESLTHFLAKLLNVVYSIYAFGSFFVTLFLSFFVYVLISWLPLSEPKRLRLIYTYNNIWFDIWGMCTGIVMETRGKEHLDSAQTYVLIGNHCNVLDIIIVGSRVVHPFKPLIKKELLKVPILGIMLKMISIVVDRTSKQSRAQSYQRMVRSLEKEISVLIFPEGTRNRSGQPLKSFYDGAFKLAINSQTPILPILLLNVRSLNPVGTFNVRPGRIILEYLPPVPVKGLTENDIPRIKQEIYEMMEKKILAEDRLFKSDTSNRTLSMGIGKST